MLIEELINNISKDVNIIKGISSENHPFRFRPGFNKKTAKLLYDVNFGRKIKMKKDKDGNYYLNLNKN